MKRPLFVFAGQSNMMGAAVYEASQQIYFENSFEYLHKPRRFGADRGSFKNFGFPAGEFAYKDLEQAYGENKAPDAVSSLDTYVENTYFCPSMCNLKSENPKSTHLFSYFSEANNRRAVALPPFVVKELEERGYPVAYAHISKGCMPILYFTEGEGADYFDLKSRDFFTDCADRFPEDDLSEKVLVWLQGEADAKNGYDHYCACLERFWKRAKGLGFTKFFIIRVDYFGNEAISEIMRAQEDFCKENKDAFIITRVASYFKHPKQPENWCISESEEFDLCRDSLYGFNNHHINEKGFKVLTKYMVPNVIRVIFENKPPVLEEEMVTALINA